MGCARENKVEQAKQCLCYKKYLKQRKIML